MKEEIKYWNDVHLNYKSSYDSWLNKYVKLFDKEDFIIELGCGRAYNSEFLINNEFNNIVACDFSDAVIKIVNKEIPNLKTMNFDMIKGLPFKNNTVDIVIADLSLHYFNNKDTIFIFDEIYRVLKKDGYLIGRVNSVNDKNHIPNNNNLLENNYYYTGKIYKRFFDYEDLLLYSKKFKICNLQETVMDRYDLPKTLWEFCFQKEKNND